MSDDLIFRIGQYCRDFRIKYLDMTLKDFSNLHGLNNKNVNAFEFGRANNIEYLYYYYKTSNDSMKKKFSRGLFELI